MEVAEPPKLKPINFEGKQGEAWHYLTDNETTEILYGGAAGGGKSFLGCVWHIINRIKYPGSRGMIGRAKIAILEQSTLKTYFKACSLMGYVSNVHYKYNSQKHIITWKNGSETILKDLFLYPADPDFQSLGSTEYTDVFIDELPEITRKAYDIVQSRIRYMLSEFGLIPKILSTCNPSPGWVKESFVSDSDGNSVSLKPHQVFIKALVTDNPDPEFVKNYVQQLSRMHSEYDKARLLEGDWDIEREIINPFIEDGNFNSSHISESAVFNPYHQLIISIDFNLNPFAVTFHNNWHDSSGEHHWQVDEGEIKQGSVQAMIKFIWDRDGGIYRQSLNSCILTGDAMGKRKELGEADNASLYLQIIRGLGMSESQAKVKGNPQHVNSRSDCNYFLKNFHDYKINPKKCPMTVRDFKVVQCDAYGEIQKKNRNDLAQRADFLDAGLRYPVHHIYKPWIDRHQKQRKIV